LPSLPECSRERVTEGRWEREDGSVGEGSLGVRIPAWWESLLSLSIFYFVVVSFIGFILLTKSLSCNDTVLTGIPFYFRVFRCWEFISLIWKELYYDKFQCYKLQEGNFKIPGRFCEVSNSAKVRPLVLVQTVQWSFQTPSCVEKILTTQCASVRILGQCVMERRLHSSPSGRSMPPPREIWISGDLGLLSL
jgi:hypothetical protein